MRSPIANWRENLQKIAHAVHDDDEDGEIYPQNGSHEYSSVSDRRNSHSFAHSKSDSRSPLPNGFDSPLNFEIEHYKAEIKRLQESEAEIKALSVNYAALLKEKEDQISRLNKDNGALKQNLEGLRNESMRTSPNNSNVLKESGNLSPNRQSKFASPMKGRSAGNQVHNGFFSKQDLANGNRLQQDYLQAREKELADLLEEKTRLVASLEASHELKIREMKMELDKERKNLANMKTKLQEEHNLNESFQEELHALKEDKKKTHMEMSQMRNELNERISEIRRLQLEMSRQDGKNTNGMVESLKREIANLQKENEKLKMEKDSVESLLKVSRNSSAAKVHPSRLTEDGSLGSFPGREELEQSLKKLEKDLKEACRDRDKAVRELSRLKQHLLEKESEEAEKMDEDTKIIEELHEINERQKAQISHLDKALKLALADQNEFRLNRDSEIKKDKETINDLNRKLANCMSTIDAKNMELLNLQTALGQYYAEIEAKERLEREVAIAREESAKLSELLKGADQVAEASKKEKEEILAKLSQAEKTAIDGNNRLHKLEEDNAKLRRALEQSMTRLNRMSVDSDYLVDRRIVIKLLVTYFQRNHSKEVLDLMVRMLGFSDEDKQRIGGAQQGAGKGVVKGVLGIPGRLVGGILGGGSAEAHAKMASEDQSFADLWVDFLLKESDEREKRDRAEGIAGSSADKGGRSPDAAAGNGSPLSAYSVGTQAAGAGIDTIPTVSKFNSPMAMNHESARLFYGNTRQTEPYDSEFSTVPLSSERTAWTSRPLR